MKTSLLVTLILAPALGAQEDTAKGRTHYKGREIAMTMHFLGAPWLVRESRERQEECSTLLRALHIEVGRVAHVKLEVVHYVEV